MSKPCSCLKVEFNLKEKIDLLLSFKCSLESYFVTKLLSTKSFTDLQSLCGHLVREVTGREQHPTICSFAGTIFQNQKYFMI